MIPEKTVIICGYPKSGNTWLTRLTAEVIGCPVTGFWGEPSNPEIAIEGLGRQSGFECYKAHHSYAQLMESVSHLGKDRYKIIYIVRDPRDVVISSVHFFMKKRIPGGLRNWRKKVNLKRLWFNLTGFSKKRQIDIFLDTLLNGGTIFPWTKVPWHEHVRQFFESELCLVRYEDLLESPVSEIKKILEYLEVSRLEDEIKKAIDIQSFETKKTRLLEEGEKSKAEFLRKGHSGEWKKLMNKNQHNRLVKKAGPVMETLGYRTQF